MSCMPSSATRPGRVSSHGCLRGDRPGEANRSYGASRRAPARLPSASAVAHWRLRTGAVAVGGAGAETLPALPTHAPSGHKAATVAEDRLLLVRRGCVARPFSRPHLLEVIELAYLGPEDVHDDVAGIEQHPVALRSAFDAHPTVSGLFKLALDLLGDGSDVPIRAARSDHHVVADGRFPPNIDHHHVLGFGIIQPESDVSEEGFRVVRGHEFGWRRARASTLKCGWHMGLIVLSSSNPSGRTRTKAYGDP